MNNIKHLPTSLALIDIDFTDIRGFDTDGEDAVGETVTLTFASKDAMKILGAQVQPLVPEVASEAMLALSNATETYYEYIRPDASVLTAKGA